MCVLELSDLSFDAFYIAKDAILCCKRICFTPRSMAFARLFSMHKTIDHGL